MNIRKLIISATVATMTLATATCFAMISKSDLYIGGIYYGQPISEVIRIFGQPEWRRSDSVKFTYSKVNIFITPSAMQTVERAIFSGGDHDLKTKAGVGRGSTYEDIISAYGEPDKLAKITGLSVTYVTDLGDGNQYMLNFSLGESSNKVRDMFFRKLRKDEYIEPKTKQIKQTKPKSTIPDYVTEIPMSELNIGGISPGQNLGYVEQVYGKPGKIDDQGFFQIYNYNDKFIVKGKLSNGFKVTSVAIYEKGLTTPSGFTVGTPYADVVKKFRSVNGIKFKGEGVESKLKGCTDYTYFCEDKQMVFIVDKKGIIQAIRVEDYDEGKFIEAKRKI